MGTYSTCALFHKAGGGAQLNPFALHEYDAHCKATSSHSLTNVCVVGSAPTAHMPDHVAKGVEAACLKKDGRYVLDQTCVAALAAAPDVPGHPTPHATEPLFAEATVCRSKLGGRFSAKCGGREITFDELRTAIGAGCEQCCESVVNKAEAKAKAGGEASNDHSKAAEGQHMPGYIPFKI